MKAWLGMELPRTFKALQAVVGKLNFAAPFIPNYKQLVRPIEALLTRRCNPKWTEPCTNALNKLVKLIFSRVRLELPDCNKPFFIYPGVHDGVGAVVIAQKGKEGKELPVLMVGRRMLLTEQKMTHLEQLVGVASWGLRQMGGLLCFAPEIVVSLPWQEQVTCVQDKEVHQRLRAKLLDLDMYNCRWQVGKNLWHVQ